MCRPNKYVEDDHLYDSLRFSSFTCRRNLLLAENQSAQWFIFCQAYEYLELSPDFDKDSQWFGCFQEVWTTLSRRFQLLGIILGDVHLLLFLKLFVMLVLSFL